MPLFPSTSPDLQHPSTSPDPEHPSSSPDPEHRASRADQIALRGVLIRRRSRRVWIYNALIVVVIGGMAATLAGDLRILVPIGSLSVLVGLVGTVMTISQAIER